MQKDECRMQKDECRMQNKGNSQRAPGFYSAFCLLHSALVVQLIRTRRIFDDWANPIYISSSGVNEI
jgi:hypothetical protein